MSGRAVAAVVGPSRRRIVEKAAVERIEDIDLGDFGKTRIQRESEQAAITDRVDLGGKVGEQRRRRVQQVLVEPDRAVFLGDEDAAVVREVDAGWQVTSADRIAAQEAARKADRECLAADERRE